MAVGTWISLRCDDAAAELAWLRAVGFTEGTLWSFGDHRPV
ncbi:hypothetical protein [Antribacter soli]|nr:hypothetical protein [Antribacter soli]